MNRSLETKRYDALLEAIAGIQLSQDVVIESVVTEVATPPDRVVRWGIWSLVVIEAARFIFALYQEYFI